MNKKQMLIMVSCCLISLVAVTAMLLFRVPLVVLLVGLILLCPLCHLLMMSQFGHDRSDKVQTSHLDAESTVQR